MIITEEQIEKALYESINEFMLEEAWGGFKAFNNTNLWNGVKNVGKGVWNGFKMYMDARTGGQWNNKYGFYANGSGKTTEMYYLNKWFNWHLNEIRSIERHSKSPSHAQQTLKWTINPQNGQKEAIETISSYDDVETYVKKNVTPQNFNSWISGYIKNRQVLQCIDSYLLKCNENVTDISSAIKWLNVTAFMGSDDGKYLAQTKEQLIKQTYNPHLQELTSIKSMIDRKRKEIEQASRFGTKWYESAITKVNNDPDMPYKLKNWLNTVIKRNASNASSDVFNKITYDEFISDYGKYYNQDAIKAAK